MNRKLELSIYFFFFILVLLFTFFLVKRINRLENCKNKEDFELVEGKVVESPYERAKQMRVKVDFNYKGIDYQYETSMSKEYNYYIVNEVYFDVMICECDPKQIFIKEKTN